MKTKEELNALKAEFEALNRKLAELTEDELEQVTGGGAGLRCPSCGSTQIVRSSAGYKCLDCGKIF